MKRLYAYSQPEVNWTRIEMLLAAFDGTITRLEKAHALIEQGEIAQAQPILLTAQRLVLALYEGIDLRHGEIPANMQQLYLYVLGSIGVGDKFDLPGAIKVMKIIQGGLLDIRETANELERSGQLQPVTEQPRLLRNIVA